MASIIVLNIIRGFQSVDLSVRIEDHDVVVRIDYATAIVVHVIAQRVSSQWTNMHVTDRRPYRKQGRQPMDECAVDAQLNYVRYR